MTNVISLFSEIGVFVENLTNLGETDAIGGSRIGKKRRRREKDNESEP